jgi:hypothetical protein
MRCRLARRSKVAVSTYLEVFVLIGLATAGSAIVYGMTAGLGESAQGPGLLVSYASIRQGQNAAVERLVFTNTGQAPISSFTLSTAGIASAQYLVTLTDAVTGSSVTPSPSSGTIPSQVIQGVTVMPGETISVTLIILSGAEFSIGTRYPVIMSSTGAQQLQFVTALPS